MNEQRLKEYLEVLTDINGNVGREDNVIKFILKELKRLGFDYWVDSIGNIVIHCTNQNNQLGKKKVMLFAHMDEVGMMVRKIESSGFLRVEKLGSINPNILHGSRVTIHGTKGDLYGVIGSKSHHFLKNEDKLKVYPVDEIYIDGGFSSKEDAERHGVIVGSPITMKPDFLPLANDLFSTKAMDDRALVAILMQLLNEVDVTKTDCDLYIVFSVQEEFNTRGIMPIVREINPQIVIGLDVTPACDTPDLKNISDISIGKGPAVTYMNHHSRGTLAGLVVNEKFLEFITNVAEQNDIPIQREVATGILTETAYISIEKIDTVVGALSLPTRYTHTPIETVSYKDLMWTHELLLAFLYEFQSIMNFGKKYDV